MGVPVKILCILMLLLHSSQQKQVFNDGKTLNLPENYAVGWMETLDDEKLISTLTIPGTHESMALYGGPLAECQAWSLEDQLNAGIRYFDLRVSGFGLIIMHGPIYQRTTLSRVLKKIREFLDKFSKETVLVRIKPVFPENIVQKLVKNIIQNDERIWVKQSFPRIGEVRGKIVFVQKNSFKLGILLSETDKKGDYIVTDVKVKEEKIKQHLEEAANQCTDDHALSLSYSSGTSLKSSDLKHKFCFLPKPLAKQINPWLYKHLEKKFEKNPKPCFGIIAMDFPGFDLIQMVIKFNRPT